MSSVSVLHTYSVQSDILMLDLCSRSLYAFEIIGIQVTIFVCRSNVLDGPVLRRHIPHIWHWGDLLCWTGSGRSHRSNGLHFPKNDQVHLSQIWFIGRNWKTRCHVYLTIEHCQRKDLYLFMVLDASPARPYVPCGRLQGLRYILAPYESIPTLHPLSTHQKRVHQCHHQENQDGWLVPALHARTKHRLNNLQRTSPRISPKTGLPQQGHLRLLSLKRNHYILCANFHMWSSFLILPSFSDAILSILQRWMQLFRWLQRKPKLVVHGFLLELSPLILVLECLCLSTINWLYYISIVFNLRKINCQILK